LDGLTGVEGKAIVSFTDGLDNESVPSTYDDIVADLEAGSIKSMTIGLQGNDPIDEVALTALGSTSYISSENIDEFANEFLEAVEGVTNVYNFTYSRSDQPITSRQMRFTFNSTLDSDGAIPTSGVEIVQPGFTEDFTLADDWSFTYPWSIVSGQLYLADSDYGDYYWVSATSPPCLVPLNSEVTFDVQMDTGEYREDYLRLLVDTGDGPVEIWNDSDWITESVTVDLEDYGGLDATFTFTFEVDYYWDGAGGYIDNFVIAKAE
jgi:hypothetical protein